MHKNVLLNLNLNCKGILCKLALVVLLVSGGGNFAWGDTVLFSTNFSTADGWTTEDIITSSTTSATRTIKGTVISFKGYSSQNVSVAAESSNGTLTFTRAFLSSSAGTITDSNPNNYMAIPVTGVVGGSVTINYTAPTKFSMYYTYDDGNTGTVVARASTASGTNVSFTISGLTNDEVTIYLGAYGYSITSLSITTYDKIDPSSSSFYALYKETTSYTNAATLIAEASLPSYIAINNSGQESSSSNSSSITTPHNFAGLSSNTYYRLMPRSSSNIVIGSISHVKSIRLYGNGTGGSGNIVVNAVKLIGAGSDFSVDPIAFSNSPKTVVEYSTGNLTEFAGEYDADTYYIYTITFTNNFSLWGLYIEYNAPSSHTVSYNANGGDGEISDDTGASITLSDGTGLTAPSGYTFAGWNTDPHGEGTSYSSGQENVKADLDLYAVWTQSGTIDDNGGTVDGAYTATYNKAGIEITTAPTNAGYAINGYYEAGTGDDLVATTSGVLQSSTTYTDASGYWKHTGDAPTLYAQWENTYELTVNVNDGDMGSAEAEETTLAEGAETTVTAAAETGFKFRSWDVSGTGSTLSSTTDNPTTFTMGTSDATVTANFSALEHYTITYNKGTNGTGDDIADGDKTEDADFTLSSSTYTYAGHVQTGWATSDGGAKVYELGGTYTDNADLALYPYWIEQYTLIYDANGGSGSMSNSVGSGSITLTANTYTKTGYTFLGWATSQANADAHTIAYVDKAAYTLNSNATLYAVWGENFYEFAPTLTTGNLAVDDVVATSSGGTMKVVSSEATLQYAANGLSSFSGKTTLGVILNDYMKAGTVISVTLYAATAGSRGFDLYTSDGTKITTFAHTSTGDATYQYTVTADDGLDGTNGFQLKKETYSAMIYLTSLAVTDCQPGGVISASGWNTYSSNKKLDLSTISGGTAFIASSIGGSTVKLRDCSAIVNAEEGLMINGEPGATFTINTTTAAATLDETNLLVGLPNGGTVTQGNYVFAWPTAYPENYGFYYINDTEPTLGAGKAYLSSPGGGEGARLTIAFDDDLPTGVDAMFNEQGTTNDKVYNLQGQRVNAPQKGLYIVNGKKYINK